MTIRAWSVGALGLIAVAFVAAPTVSRATPPAKESPLAKKLLATVGDGFRIRRTEHFTIAYDTPYETLRPLVGRLEGTYDAVATFCRDCGFLPQEPSAELGVILFNRHKDFTEYLGRIGLSSTTIAGVYEQQANLSAFCNAKSSPSFEEVSRKIDQARRELEKLGRRRSSSKASRERKHAVQREISILQTRGDALVKRFNRFVIQHEAAHQVLFNFGVHVRGADNPTWFVEGLATQFELPQAGAREGRWRINQMRLADFRDLMGVAPGEKMISEADYAQLLLDGRLVALDTFISQPELFTNRGDEITLRYAQAWALVIYLQHTRREMLGNYVASLARRRPGRATTPREQIEAFATVFGNPDDRFQREWVSHVLKMRFDPKESGR